MTKALDEVERTKENWCKAEIYRLKGGLFLQTSHVAEAEDCFLNAIAIAQEQQAKSFELRATTSLARLWQQQNKSDEAREKLAAIYHWFTEGFDTKDLQDARALLEELGGADAHV